MKGFEKRMRFHIKRSSKLCILLSNYNALKGPSQLWDRADLDTTFASLKSVYLIRGGRRNSLEERKIRGNNPESLIQTH